MEIFASWAGDASKQVALALRQWIPNVLQNVEVFVSTEDLNKGRRWSTQLAEKLDSCSFGIVCVTPTSLGSEWLHFEAGALAKSVPGSLEDNRVVPLLVGTSVSDLTNVLAQFQIAECSKDDLHRLMAEVNQLADGLPPERFEAAFDRWWPILGDQLPGLLDAARREAGADGVDAGKTRAGTPMTIEVLAEEVRLSASLQERSMARIERLLRDGRSPSSTERDLTGGPSRIQRFIDNLFKAAPDLGSDMLSASLEGSTARISVTHLPSALSTQALRSVLPLDGVDRLDFVDRKQAVLEIVAPL